MITIGGGAAMGVCTVNYLAYGSRGWIVGDVIAGVVVAIACAVAIARERR